MNDIDKIVALLDEEAIEKRIAAAIVLGEIKAKGPEVVDALMRLVEGEVPALQRHGLHALTRIGAKKVVPRLFALLASSDSEVRYAATRAIVSVGDEVVPLIRKRMIDAGHEERRGLDAILADLGGKDAFTVLLSSLATSEGEAAKAAALAVRQHVRTASAAERRNHLAQTERFLADKKKGATTAAAVTAAIKILGYLEDEKAIPTLLSYARDTKQSAAIRQEALIALRFTLGEKKGEHNKVVTALIDAAGDPDRVLAQTALLTLGSLTISAEHGKQLEKLIDHPDLERARFVIEQVGRQKGADTARLLVKVLSTAEKKRAEIAAAALNGNLEAVTPLAKALLETNDPDRRWVIRNVLRTSPAMAQKVPSPMRKQLLEAAMERLSEGERGYEAYLDVARDADPDAAATALRELAQKLRKKNPDKAAAVLTILCRSDRANDDDRYQRAALELLRSPRDTRAVARAGDESLKQIMQLVDRGFDMGAALRKDRSLGLEELFYVGFHFAEERHALGPELLSVVVDRGGRQKIAKAAKNKLNLTGPVVD